MLTLFDLIVVAAVLGLAWWGGIVGLRAAAVAALEVTCCLLLAIVLHETLAGYLHAGLVMAFGDSFSQTWSILLCFVGIAWGTLAGIRTWLHPRDDEDEEADDGIDPLIDRIGGILAGGCGGVVFVGGLLITLSMIPFLAGLKPSGGRMLLDVGGLVVRMADSFAGERFDGRSLPIYGEPASRSSDLAARLTSEPWFDADEDGSFGEADRYRDVDGNGTFTADLYYTDVDQDGMRRIGLLDKYVVGRWDGDLLSLDRNREPAKPANGKGKPGATPAKPAKPTPGKPTKSTPSKPAEPERKTAEPQPGDDF